jgi:hypothetical protein
VVASGTGTNQGLGTYDNTIGNWSYCQAGTITSGDFASGVGRFIKLVTQGDISFSGTFNNVDAAIIPMTSNTTGFNLLGNPYLAAVSASELLKVNTALLAEQTVWAWNQATNRYDQYNLGKDLEVAPGQGFFVKANAAGNFSVTEAMQSHASGTFQRESPRPEIELILNIGATSKHTEIFYIDGTSTGFDNGYDSSVFGGLANKFELYTRTVDNEDGRNLGIQSLPNANLENMVIPLGINAVAGSTLEFAAKATNLPTGINVYLEDKNTNTFTRIDTGAYRVTVTNTLNGVEQFYIHTTSSVLSLPTEALENVSVYVSNNETLKIKGINERDTQLQLYSVLGKRVLNTRFIANENNSIALPRLPTGLYLVKIENEEGVLNRKLIIE